MIYWFQDPLPFDIEEDYDDRLFENPDWVSEFADDGWRDPGPCPICGTPHTACIADHQE